MDLPPVFESESETLRRKLQLWRFRVLSAELRRRTGGGDGLDRSAAFAEQLRGVSSRVQQVFLPMLRAVSDPDVQGRLIVVAQTHARDFIESKRLRTEGVAMQAVAELMAETGGRAPRATSEGRIRLADVRKRMIEFAVADGGDQRAAEKSVPNSRTLSAVFKGVLSLAVGRDRRGAFLVVACEEDLRRVETAMTNLGVDLPWSAASVPLASPDSDGEQPIADAVPPGLAGVARPLRPSDNGRATHVDDDYLPSPTAEDAEAGFIVDPEVDAS